MTDASNPTGQEPMENAHKRKKQPELVRRALLDEAAKLAVSGGLGAITVQAVSAAAGVTKGGLMHHFPSKQTLVDALFQDLLDSVGTDLDERIELDETPYGSFTRAYVDAVLEMGWEGGFSPMAPLSILMLTDDDLRAKWSAWFNDRLRRHDPTDGDIRLALVRLAADGIWLADLSGIDIPNRGELRERLVDATQPPTDASPKQDTGIA